MQRLGEFEIAAAGRAVEGEVAAVDDEVRPRPVDMRAHAIEIIGEFWQSAGGAGIRNLRQTKFSHAIFLTAPILPACRVEKVTAAFRWPPPRGPCQNPRRSAPN